MGHIWVTIGWGVSQQLVVTKLKHVKTLDLTTAEHVPLSTPYSSSRQNSKSNRQRRRTRAWNQQSTHICLVKNLWWTKNPNHLGKGHRPLTSPQWLIARLRRRQVVLTQNFKCYRNS
jgi:hypothetical protein